MLVAIDTATPAGSVALADGGRLLALRTFDAAREHSRRLFGELDAALTDARRGPDEIDAVAVTIGPGSFTGLRIGLSAAKGLCRGLGLGTVIAVSTLEVLAARLPWCRWPVCPLLDARRGEVYAAVYDTSDGLPRPLEAPAATTPGDLLARWRERDVLFTGDGIDACSAAMADVAAVRLAPAAVRRPCAAALTWIAEARRAAGAAADVQRLEPEYLRTPAFVPAAGGPG